MLNFRSRHVVAYIQRSGADIERAAKEFFGKHELTSDILNFWNKNLTVSKRNFISKPLLKPLLSLFVTRRTKVILPTFIKI